MSDRKPKITDEEYKSAAQKFIKKRLKQFEEAGGWEVVNEKAKNCTYQRYLEVGNADCENTAKIMEVVKATLEAEKRELQAKIERLEARESQRIHYFKTAEVIVEIAKETENISQNCIRNANVIDKQNSANKPRRENQLVTSSPNPALNREAPVTESHLLTSTSTNDQNNILAPVQRKPTKRFVEKPFRPPTSLTGSFTLDQDEETVASLEPIRTLTFDDTMTSFHFSTPQTRSDSDTVKHSSKKCAGPEEIPKVSENAGPVNISRPPELKSELAKQWIREVAKKKY